MIDGALSQSELTFEWVHIAYEERRQFVDTYGFSGSQNHVNLEGVLIKPAGRASRTLLVFMHPASTLQLLPVPQAAARAGAHVLCAGSRYARNDTAAIFENIVLDLGAYVSHAKKIWGYERIVLVGWSGGGSLALLYQAEAEHPTITQTPAGDAVDLTSAALIPADAVIFQAAHTSRARLLAESIDPSVIDEFDPDSRDRALDLYDPRNPNQPPYSPDFIAHFRAAQLARVRRITVRVRDTLEQLKSRNTAEHERGFVTHRTLADPRFLDERLDPNDRRKGWCYLGNPETVNSGPVGLARFSTLRAWLSQWSMEDTRADGLSCVGRIKAPLLVIENSADDAVPQPHCREIYDAAVSLDKSFAVIGGASHYYAGQPDKLEAVTRLTWDWLQRRALIEA